MIGLCGPGLGRRLLQCGSLLERFVITLHIPPFFVDCGDALIRQSGVAADKIENPD